LGLGGPPATKPATVAPAAQGDGDLAAELGLGGPPAPKAATVKPKKEKKVNEPKSDGGDGKPKEGDEENKEEKKEKDSEEKKEEGKEEKKKEAKKPSCIPLPELGISCGKPTEKKL